MPILELCAGYGGLGIAVEALTGDKVAYVAENHAAASKVLSYRFPEAPNIGDITVYDWSRLIGLVDIITAGFPCQDISNAGRRAGIHGARSGIWKHVAEAVRVLRPRIVFLENVSAIRRRGIEVVLGDLAAIGYDARWVSLRASAVGAPHPRDRWFLIAVPADAGHGAEPEWPRPTRREGGEWPAVRRFARCGGEDATGTHSAGLGIGGVESAWSELPSTERSCFDAVGNVEDPAHTDCVGRCGRSRDESAENGRGEPSNDGYSPPGWWGVFLRVVRRWEWLTQTRAPVPTEVGPRGGRRLAARFPEWMMGVPAGHVTDVPGLSRTDQLMCIGNGVVPVQAYEAYHYLLTAPQYVGEGGRERERERERESGDTKIILLVGQIAARWALLKTPTTNLSRNGSPQHPDKRKAGGHGPSLEDEAVFLLPAQATYDEETRHV